MMYYFPLNSDFSRKWIVSTRIDNTLILQTKVCVTRCTLTHLCLLPVELQHGDKAEVLKPQYAKQRCCGRPISEFKCNMFAYAL